MPDSVSPAATVYRTGACGPGRAKTVPGWMIFGLAPIRGRLAAYSACQPPCTASALAMLDRVSPGWTTYLAVAAALGAVARGVDTLALLARVTWVMLLAMRWFAWAERTDPVMPAAIKTGRMHQASTTHADFVHLCTVVLLSFLGISAERCGFDAEGHEPVGKERT